jgi:hypothetical protein
LEEIANSRNINKRSDVLWLYRGLWQFYTKILNSLVRITSADLRFWLRDEPYIADAFSWAEKDYLNAKVWLSQRVPGGERYLLSLETPVGLNDFWEFLEKK